MHFENEVEPGVLHSSAQQTYNLQQFHATGTELTHNQLHVVSALDIPTTLVFVECCTGAFQVRSRFQTTQIAKWVYFWNAVFEWVFEK